MAHTHGSIARRLALAAMAALTLAAPPVHAGPPTVLHVDASAPAGGDGATWQTAFRHLQDALAAAASLAPAEIRVAQGVYTPDRTHAAPGGTGDRLAHFRLLDAVTLLGGHAGRNAADPDERDPARFVSTLSGDLLFNDDAAVPDPRADNAHHVIESWGNDHTAVVDGFTIAGGQADRPFDDAWWPDRRDDSGAGAILVGSDAVFRGCLFTGNHAEANASVWVALTGPFAYAEAGGGALFIAGGAPTIEDCVFDRNSANRVGGAINLNRSTATIARCVLSNNAVGSGGFNDVSFGGAMGDASWLFDGPKRGARIESCVFVNNTARGEFGYAGALFTIFSWSEYANCLFLANDAPNVGAILVDNISQVSFHNCAIVGNTSRRMAAGLHEISEVPLDRCVIANSILWANRSDQIFELRNENLISDNGNLEIYHSIVENSSNKPVFALAIDTMLDTDPAFTDPVGPDAVPFSGDENLRPAPNSPAIDAGASFRVPAWVTTDLDAKPRFLDAPTIPDTGLGPAPIVDIGPYESGPGCSPADLAEPYGQLDFFDLAAYLDLYHAGDPAADLAPPIGVLNFFDLAAYLDAYNAGCP